ncbi:MAG: hypothetical protein AAGA54_22850 [Myxococcota bacterium]
MLGRVSCLASVLLLTACFDPDNSTPAGSGTEGSSTTDPLTSGGVGTMTTAATTEASGATTTASTSNATASTTSVDSTTTSTTDADTSSSETTATTRTSSADESTSTGEPADPMNIVFVTAAAFDGDLGGVAGGDQICSDAATAAGLDGTFIAFLGLQGGAEPRERLQGSRGWVRTDGRPVMDLPTDPLLYPIRVDEMGNDVGGDVEVWTGDRSSAIFPPDTCADWTSSSAGDEGVAGFADAVASDFHDATRDPCSFSRRLYCFQTDHDLPIELPTETGRTAFIADASWDGFGGITAADNICQGRADMAGLAGQYLAVLSGTGSTAASRFDLDGENWVRPDGLPVAASPAAFFNAPLWDIPPHMEADGDIPSGGRTLWTGPAWDSTGSNAQTCNNWQGFSSGLAGRSSRSDKVASIGSVDIDDCDDSGFGLYCLQE